MIEGVILAAGRSRRAGLFKPAHLHRGQPLLRHAVDGLAPWCERVIVVAGHRRDEIAAMTAELPKTEVLLNPDPDAPMFSSIRIAAAALDPTGTGFFVLPADCPLVTAATCESLLDAFTIHDAKRPTIPEHAGRGGHPVLLPTTARTAILNAPPDTTLRDIIRALDPMRVPVTDPSVLMDLDTPADFAALAKEQ